MAFLGTGADYIVWNPDPDIIHLGPVIIRWYGLCFVLVFMTGYMLWQWQMRRMGAKQEYVERWLVWAVVCVIVGARLGHVIFYDPVYYFSQPWKILMVWKGGLASHGATVGLVFGLWLWSYKFKYPFREVIDRFAMSATMGATFVRVGNLINSEIVGRVTDVPWAFRFVRYADRGMYPRHPAQIYEILLGLFVFACLLVTDHFLKEKRPRWLMTGMFFGLYFTGRFFVEFFKEYQTLDPASSLTMGQYLSIAPALGGIALAVYAIIKNPQPPPPLSEQDEPEEGEESLA